MNSTQTGRRAEHLVLLYLQNNGFKIIASNWSTKTCEIDLIAYKQRIIYFVEVKFRSKTSQGTGLDYITPTKLKRMSYAAELWVAKYKWKGCYTLSGASVSADGSINFIEQI